MAEIIYNEPAMSDETLTNVSGMSSPVDDIDLAIIVNGRFIRGELKSVPVIADYLNGNASAPEALVATLWDAAKADNLGPSAQMADLLIQMLQRGRHDPKGREAWDLVKREAEGVGMFFKLANDVDMSFDDTVLIYDAYLKPALQRIAEWVIANQ